MHKLELKVPPVFVLIFCILLVYLSQCLPAVVSIPELSLLYSIISFGLGLAIIMSGVWEFRKVKTTVNPTTPDKASILVNSGIYLFTRNPMYLGMAMIIGATIFYFFNLYSIFCLVLFITYITRFQIIPEETIIEQLFGQEYIDYKSKVRRWI